MPEREKKVFWIREQIQQLEEQFKTPTFCSEKFLSNKLLLHTGIAYSCCKTGSHKVSPVHLGRHPTLLLHPRPVLAERDDVMRGKRLRSCRYCWDVEDAGGVSRRMFETVYKYPREITDQVKQTRSPLPYKQEIIFDNVCNLKCVYCHPVFSSKWAEEIDAYGPYPVSISDKSYDKTELIPNNQHNPYTEAFWAIWDELYASEGHLILSGGEPLLSKHIWKILDHIAVTPNPTKIVNITTNLSTPSKLIERFIRTASVIESNLQHLTVAVSIDTVGRAYEYIRLGSTEDILRKNIVELLEWSSLLTVTFMTTVNVLSVTGLPELVTWVKELNERFPNRISIFMTHLSDPAYLDFRLLDRKRTLPILQEAIRINDGFSDDRSVAVGRALLSLFEKDADDVFYTRRRPEFKQFIEEKDRRQGTDFYKTFPDLHYLME